MNSSPRSPSTPITPHIDPLRGSGPAAIGTVVAGRYRLRRLVAVGGWGHVFEARCVRSGRRVAVKMLRDERLDQRRFLREVKLTQRIAHPNVVRVLDADANKGVLVLEFVEGRDLSTYLSSLGAPHLPIAIRLLDQIAAGLDAAHRHGVLHRDLKPSNVMLTVVGGRLQAKIIDFGLGVAKDSDTITDIGETVGTPGYMAPEQLYGASYDARTDVYAWGVLAYQLITGQPAFGGTEHEQLDGVLQREPTSIGDLRAKVPVALEEIVMKAMRKSPDARFASAARIRQALRFVQGPPQYRRR